MQVSEQELSVEDAVSSYLFNSQLLGRSDGKMMLLCPNECQQNEAARAVTEKIVEDENPIEQVLFMDLRQSMNNGGGPACLRLRVTLNQQEEQKMHQGIVFNQALDHKLVDWVERHYREQLAPGDLSDPNLITECQVAFDELESILDFEDGLLSEQFSVF